MSSFIISYVWFSINFLPFRSPIIFIIIPSHVYINHKSFPASPPIMSRFIIDHSNVIVGNKLIVQIFIGRLLWRYCTAHLGSTALVLWWARASPGLSSLLIQADNAVLVTWASSCLHCWSDPSDYDLSGLVVLSWICSAGLAGLLFCWDNFCSAGPFWAGPTGLVLWTY